MKLIQFNVTEHMNFSADFCSENRSNVYKAPRRKQRGIEPAEIKEVNISMDY